MQQGRLADAIDWYNRVIKKSAGQVGQEAAVAFSTLAPGRPRRWMRRSSRRNKRAKPVIPAPRLRRISIFWT